MKTVSSRVRFPIVTANHFKSQLELNFHNCSLFGCGATAAVASHHYYNSFLQHNGPEVHIKKKLSIYNWCLKELAAAIAASQLSILFPSDQLNEYN